MYLQNHMSFQGKFNFSETNAAVGAAGSEAYAIIPSALFSLAISSIFSLSRVEVL